MGLRIFMHSVNLVFNQLSGALRISTVLYLLSLVVSAIGYYFFLQSTMSGQDGPQWQLYVTSIVAGLLYMWIAVAWHRFVLLDEMPGGWLPSFNSDRMLAYFGRSLLLILVAIAVAIPIGFVNGMLIYASNGSQPVAFLTTLVLIFVILVISYRLAPMFPGAAVGQSIGLRAAWTATSGATGTILGLAIISALASVAIDLPTFILRSLPAGQLLVFLWAAVTGWIKLMVGASILTTIYGHYVEKREIA